MKKLFVFSLVLLMLGCGGTPEKAPLNRGGDEGDNNTSSKPTNGQLTLVNEFLKIGISGSAAQNAVVVDLLPEVKIMSKDYYFLSATTAKSYMIQLPTFDHTVCSSISELHFFLMHDSDVTEVFSGVPFTLGANMNLRLRLYTEQMACNGRMTVNFSFNQQ